MHAFVRDNGIFRDLGTLGGSTSFVFDINNRGQIVGYSETSSGATHATVWTVQHRLF